MQQNLKTTSHRCVFGKDPNNAIVNVQAFIKPELSFVPFQNFFKGAVLESHMAEQISL